MYLASFPLKLHCDHIVDPIARDLMHEAFKELKKRSCDLLWCNARLVAVDFYKSLRFRIYGDIFYIEGIGPHYYMYKEI